MWWTREKIGEYFPVFSKDHPPLLDYLRTIKVLTQDKQQKLVNPYAKSKCSSYSCQTLFTLFTVVFLQQTMLVSRGHFISKFVH